MIIRKMPVDYKNCDYLSPDSNTKYGYFQGDVKNGQAHYMCNKVMPLARKLGG